MSWLCIFLSCVTFLLGWENGYADPVNHRIEECLAAFLPGQSVSVNPIKRGHQDARNYLVETNGAKYLLKLLPHDLEEEDALKEIYMIREGALLGIAPRVIASSDRKRAVLMEYIETPTLTPSVAGDHAREIGSSLRTMHGSAKNPHVGDAKYLDEAEHRFRFVEERSDLDSPIFKDAAKAITFVREKAPLLTSEPLANVHGDIHPQNLFWTDDGFKMIDWEFTVWDNPYHDLGRFSTSLALDDSADEELLEGYFGRSPTEEEREQFLLSKRLNYANKALIGYKITLFILEKEPQPLDFSSEPLEWAHYMESFAVASERMPLQFFYDYANRALAQISL